MTPGTALAERTKDAIVVAPVVKADELDLIKRTVANGATGDELKLYLYDCARQGVHPLDKLIHFTKRGGKYTPITSIDFMRTRAADSGEYAGNDDAEFDPTPSAGTGNGTPQWARVTVWRLVAGERCSFTATARWSEYCPPSGQDHMWRKMPHTMLAKCAEALALRKGFPRQLAGLYAREELDQASDSSTTSDPARLVAAPATADEVPAVIDTETGVQLPEAPAGFHYLTRYSYKAPWHEATALNWDLKGGSLKVSTKLKIGELLARAANESLPAKLDVTMRPNRTDEAYLNKIELLKPAPDENAAIDADIAKQDGPF